MARYSRKCLVSILFIAATLTACSSDTVEQSEEDTDNSQNPVTTQPELLGKEWTLETVRTTDGEYRPLPLESTWRLTFDISGKVSGDALCNAGSGIWQADDSTLSFVSWTQTESYCDSIERIPVASLEIIERMVAGESVMLRVDAGRLFIDTGDGAQLVFSGRPIIEGEQAVEVQTLVRTLGGSRASNAAPVFGDLLSPYVVYRDAALLESDYARLPAETVQWPALPTIDFTSSIVVGAYLPLDFAISSYVVVRGAKLSSAGLEIEIGRYDPNVPDQIASANCGADSALSAPWTLVRIDSVVEKVSFTEMLRPYCSGVPVGSD